MAIGEKIKELRERKKVTQTELADAVGTTKQNIYKYETGIITNIPSDRVEAIAKYFNVSPAYLMGWEEPHYGNRIMEVRIANNYTIEDLANKTNIDVNRLRDFEKDKIQPELSELSVIAKAFGISIEDLYWKNFHSNVELMEQFSHEHNASLAYLFNNKEQADYIIKKLLVFFSRQNISNRKIAKFLNIQEAEVEKWKTGRSTTFLNYIEKLAELVGADVSEFMGDGLRYDGRSQTEIEREIVEKYLFNETNIADKVLEDVKHYAKISLQMWKDNNSSKG